MHIGQIHAVRKLYNGLHIQQASVRGGSVLFLTILPLEQNDVIPANADHVGMIAGNLRLSSVRSCCQSHTDVEDIVLFTSGHRKFRPVQIRRNCLNLLLGDAGKHLQLLVRISCGNAGSGRSGNSP